MTREELFEIKKDITVMADFEEEFESESEKIKYESMKTAYTVGYKAMDTEDQRWVDSRFVQWIDIYMLRNQPKHCGATPGSCSGCK